MAGMYTAPERIERDGYLVAFEGEVMSEEEAARRGLLGPAEPEIAAEPVEITGDEELEAMNVSELRALAARAGIALARNAAKAKAIEALKAAR